MKVAVLISLVTCSYACKPRERTDLKSSSKALKTLSMRKAIQSQRLVKLKIPGSGQTYYLAAARSIEQLGQPIDRQENARLFDCAGAFPERRPSGSVGERNGFQVLPTNLLYTLDSANSLITPVRICVKNGKVRDHWYEKMTGFAPKAREGRDDDHYKIQYSQGRIATIGRGGLNVWFRKGDRWSYVSFYSNLRADISDVAIAGDFLAAVRPTDKALLTWSLKNIETRPDFSSMHNVNKTPGLTISSNWFGLDFINPGGSIQAPILLGMLDQSIVSDSVVKYRQTMAEKYRKKTQKFGTSSGGPTLEPDTKGKIMLKRSAFITEKHELSPRASQKLRRRRYTSIKAIGKSGNHFLVGTNKATAQIWQVETLSRSYTWSPFVRVSSPKSAKQRIVFYDDGTRGEVVEMDVGENGSGGKSFWLATRIENERRSEIFISEIKPDGSSPLHILKLDAENSKITNMEFLPCPHVTRRDLQNLRGKALENFKKTNAFPEKSCRESQLAISDNMGNVYVWNLDIDIKPALSEREKKRREVYCYCQCNSSNGGSTQASGSKHSALRENWSEEYLNDPQGSCKSWLLKPCRNIRSSFETYSKCYKYKRGTTKPLESVSLQDLSR